MTSRPSLPLSRQGLLEYLNAACNIENAIFACEEAINHLNARSNSIFTPTAPTRTVAPHSTKSSDSSFWGWVVGIIITVVFTNGGGFPGFFVGGLIGLFVGSLITGGMDNSHAQQQKAAAEAAATRTYNANLTAYNAALTASNSAKAAIAKEVDRLRARIRSLDLLRSQLYNKGVLHTSFRNIVAVNQLRDYLEMGISDRLEGSNGLYAQYLMDVRTDRICGSIKELQQALERGMSRITGSMNSLTVAVRETNSRISAMDRSLNSSLNNMQNSLIAAQNASAAQMQTYMQQANSQLSAIQNTLSTAAYNQYVTARETRARAYLQRLP